VQICLVKANLHSEKTFQEISCIGYVLLAGYLMRFPSSQVYLCDKVNG